MSTILPPADLEPDLAADAPPVASLAELRAELDRLDDCLHDTLMSRAEVVERIARVKGGVALRPGREADIIRRLLARHGGALPPATIVRIWRELLAGTTTMQGKFLITVCDTDPGNPYAWLAREHFGALTPMRVHGSPAQAIAEVSSGVATAAVLPMPAEDEPASAAWWIGLLNRDNPRIYVVAQLPFWRPRPDAAPSVQALVVAAMAPDASARDRSLLGLELSAAVSQARLIAGLGEAGFSPGRIVIRRESGAGTARALVDVGGYVAEGDPRLSAIRPAVQTPVVLGAYAVPIGGNST